MCALLIAASTLSVVLTGGGEFICPYGIDTFEDGTTLNWGGGTLNPNGPVLANIPDGGPLGLGDNYLQVSVDGGYLAFRNATQWAGDYALLGIPAIAIDLDVMSADDDVELRLVMYGFDGGVWASATPVLIVPGWNTYAFPLNDIAMTHVQGGSGDFADVLGDVVRIQFRHDPGAAPTPPGGGPATIAAVLGVDNIHCMPEPGALILLVTGIAVLLRRKC